MKDSSRVKDNIASPADGSGGGIEILAGTLKLRQDALVSGNSAATGGGIWIFDQTGSVRLAGESSVTQNAATIRGRNRHSRRRSDHFRKSLGRHGLWERPRRLARVRPIAPWTPRGMLVT